MKQLLGYLTGALVATVLIGSAKADTEPSPQRWVVTWAASPQAPQSNAHLQRKNGQTIRERFRATVGGAILRVQLSNEFGATPLVLGAATIASPVDEATVKPESVKSLTFNGRMTAVIPAGAPLLSDPVAFALHRGSEVTISLYLPQQMATATQHTLALRRAVISPPGDFTRSARIEAGATIDSSVLVTAIIVPAARSQRLLVTLGDSLTDGDGDIVDADSKWPAALARRLVNGGGPAADIAVVNEGEIGNQLLRDVLGINALTRFDRDVLSLPGVTHVILLEGINDIGMPGAAIGSHVLSEPSAAPTLEDLTGAYQQLIARAHAAGIRIIGATLPPFEGARIAGYYSESKESMRQAVNHWIRTSRAFDAVIDFDAVLRDAQHPSQMQSRYVSSDHLHPNGAGYQAMADAVDVRLLN